MRSAASTIRLSAARSLAFRSHAPHSRDDKEEVVSELVLCGVSDALRCGDGLKLAESRQARECLAFELPDALPRQVELVPDRLQRPRLALETEAKLEDAALALRQRCA